MSGVEKTVGASTAVDVEQRAKHVDPTLEKHAHDADEAMKAFEDLHGEAIELDQPTNRRLLKTIDWQMMPIMCFVYGMNYLDSMCARRSLERYTRGTGTDIIVRNNPVVCQRHGHRGGFTSGRGSVSMAGKHVLLW